MFMYPFIQVSNYVSIVSRPQCSCQFGLGLFGKPTFHIQLDLLKDFAQLQGSRIYKTSETSKTSEVEYRKFSRKCHSYIYSISTIFLMLKEYRQLETFLEWPPPKITKSTNSTNSQFSFQQRYGLHADVEVPQVFNSF